MKNTPFKGTGVAIVTPFKDDLSIDYTALGMLINRNITHGIDYIVLLGTTGESPTITEDEKHALIDFAADTINERIPLVVGFGGYSTQEVIHSIKSTDLEGVDGILSVSPYYNKPSQEGLYNHFTAIANASPVPVIIYNVPGRTGSNICAETVLRLAKTENIVGIKEASGNLSQIMQIIKNKPGDFLVISGDDAITLPIIALGGHGVISVLANAYPRETSAMVIEALNKHFDKAATIHYRLLDLMELLFAEGSPSGIKETLSIMNLCSNNLRPPLTPVSKHLHEKIEMFINNFK